MTEPSEPADDRNRSRQNVIVLVVLAALVVLGYWLFSELRAYLKVEACLEAGLRNCTPEAINSR